MFSALTRVFPGKRAPKPRPDPRPDPRPVFGYFDRPDTTLIADFTTEWRRHFPQFRIFGDADVLPILDRMAPRHCDIYRGLRIPAAKADLARLALLHQHGGLYVDCHCGARDPGAIRAVLDSLDRHRLICVERPRTPEPGAYLQRLLINGVIFAQAGLPLLDDLLQQAFENLEHYLTLVRDPAKPPEYDIWSMLGAYVLTQMVLEPAAEFRDFRRPLRGGVVRIIALPDLPIQLGAHQRLYNGPDRTHHWSNRQGQDTLFQPMALPALIARYAAPGTTG